jgi:hypothetical protein
MTRRTSTFLNMLACLCGIRSDSRVETKRWYHRAAHRAGASFRCHERGKRFRLMQVTQLLALSGVTMAAGAMISFSFALSPPLTLLPSRLVPVDIYRNVIPQKHQTVETVGAGIADAFKR